jgi:hypothetical protein
VTSVKRCVTLSLYVFVFFCVLDDWRLTIDGWCIIERRNFFCGTEWLFTWYLRSHGWSDACIFPLVCFVFLRCSITRPKSIRNVFWTFESFDLSSCVWTLLQQENTTFVIKSFSFFAKFINVRFDL